MRSNRVWIYASLTAVLAVAGGVAWSRNQSNGSPIVTATSQNGTVRSITDFVVHPNSGMKTDRFTLTARPKMLTLRPGLTVQAMTFNSTAPGPLLKVRQGDFVVVTVRNKLSVPITVHWHGIAVPGAEDGVPGLTQNPIQPGATYVYRFVAKDPGTYWYHSHVDGVKEVGAGLFGGIVIENSSAPKSDKDYTLILHEWSTSNGDSNSTSGMGGMNMDGGMGMGSGGMNMGSSGNMMMGSPNLLTTGFRVTTADWNALNEMNGAYQAYTVNGTASGNTMLNAKPGDTVRLRLINAGNVTHLMTLTGVSFKVVSMDGQAVAHPSLIRNQLLPIGPAQRYDVEFTMPKSGNVTLSSGDRNDQERMELRASIGQGMSANQASETVILNEPWFDFTRYGSGRIAGRPTFMTNQHFDKTFDMTLGVGIGDKGMIFTINGKSYPNVPPYVVKTGDTVKIHIVNTSGYIHPMHLHGHDFQVLTRDGKPVTGSPIFLDTLEVLPGETYDIAFKADNPGLWMFHCHDLHHAAAGMDMVVQYTGISTPYDMSAMAE